MLIESVDGSPWSVEAISAEGLKSWAAEVVWEAVAGLKDRNGIEWLCMYLC